MKMNKVYKVILIIAVLTFSMIIWSTKSCAATGSFSVSPASVSLDVGGTTTIKITATNCGGQFTFKSSDSSVVSVSASQQWIESETATITLTAKKSGSATITITANNVADTSENDVTGSKTVKVTVKEKPTGGSGNGNNDNKTPPPANTQPKKGNVSSCYINGISVKEYLPVKNKDSVSMKVNTSTGEGLKIYNDKTKKTYTAKSGATTNIQIVEGNQTLTITLDTGYSTTRRIISTKEGEDTPPNVIEEKPKEEVKVFLKSLAIKGVNSEEEKVDFTLTPAFSSEVYEYSLTIPEEQNDITKLAVEALANQDDFIVEVTGNENLVEGENLITILVKSKDGEKTAIYKIKVNKEQKTEAVVATAVEEEPIIPEEANKSREIIKMVIVIFTGIIAVAGIIFAVVEYRYGKKNNDENDFGTIPYASIGFEKEESNKEDVLEDLREEPEEEKETSDVVQENKPKRKGKHF